jgi:hypothetical protein
MVLASQLLSHSSQYSLISASLSHLAKTHDCKGPRRADLKPTTSEKKPTKGGDETHDGEGEQRESLPCLCMEVCFTVDCKSACLFGCSDLLRVCCVSGLGLLSPLARFVLDCLCLFCIMDCLCLCLCMVGF